MDENFCPTAGLVNSAGYGAETGNAEDDGKGGTTYGERALWRAVITQALLDAGKKAVTSQDKVEKGRAIAWLAGRNKDFEMVCHFAGLDPRYVIQKASEAIKRDCQWRKAATKKVKNSKGVTRDERKEGVVVALRER